MLLKYNVTLSNTGICMINTNHKPHRKVFLPMFGHRGACGGLEP